MRSLALAVTALAALLVAPAASIAMDAQAEPYQLVRALQRAQDQLASGAVAEPELQRKLLKHIGKRLATAADAEWREARNGWAAATFVLSGGDPMIAQHLLENDLLGEAQRSLLSGALAYATGDRRRAEALIGGIDARTLPRALAGHIALVQSSFYRNTDPKRALLLLDLARLMSPGTLVEEAALRRGVVIAGADGDLERLERLALTYLRRFAGSIYRRTFEQQFADLIVRLDYQGMPERMEHLQRVLSKTAPARRRGIYLYIARSAVTRGQTVLARFAAGEAERLSEAGSPQAQRARLYRAAADIVTERMEQAVAYLRTFEREQIAPRDRPILDAALQLAREIKAGPQARAWHVADSSRASGAEVAGKPLQAGDSFTGLMERGERLLDDVETLQRKVSP